MCSNEDKFSALSYSWDFQLKIVEIANIHSQLADQSREGRKSRLSVCIKDPGVFLGQQWTLPADRRRCSSYLAAVSLSRLSAILRI